MGYQPALDGLRALAVTAVIVQHAGYVVGGYFGVTIFFVISGYLITGMLLAEHDSTGVIALGAFYRRRFARLAPALSLAVVVILGWLLATGVSIASWWAGLVGTLTYTTDLLLAAPLVQHVGSYEWSWSLGIEEQFYLVWPLLMILLLGRRAGRVSLAVVAAAVVALAWVQRARLSYGRPSHERVNFTFDTHMDAIALGALLALLLAGGAVGCSVQSSRLARVVVQCACVLAAVCVVAVIRQPWQTERLTSRDLAGYGQVGLLCAVVVGGVVLTPLGPVSRLLALPPFVHVGKLSYGLYVWNLLLVSVFEHLTGHLPAHTGFALLAWVLALLAVAELSFRWVELPLRRRWAHPRPAVAGIVPEAPAPSVRSV